MRWLILFALCGKAYAGDCLSELDKRHVSYKLWLPQVFSICCSFC